MLSPEAQEVVRYLGSALRVEVSAKRVGGRIYFDGPLETEVTVRLCLEDEVISESTSYVSAT